MMYEFKLKLKNQFHLSMFGYNVPYAACSHRSYTQHELFVCFMHESSHLERKKLTFDFCNIVGVETNRWMKVNKHVWNQDTKFDQSVILMCPGVSSIHSNTVIFTQT